MVGKDTLRSQRQHYEGISEGGKGHFNNIFDILFGKSLFEANGEKGSELWRRGK